MIWRIAFAAIICMSLFAAVAQCQRSPQAITEAFESSPHGKIFADSSKEAPRYLDFFSNAEVSAISFYQTNLSPKSISRCPFSLSCSRFAVESIKQRGPLFGACLFIDRYFYRENEEAYLHYGLVEVRDGTLKLDDAIK